MLSYFQYFNAKSIFSKSIYMIQYLLTAIIFVILDGTYLNLIKGYFNKQVKSIQGSDIQINIVATGLTYVVLIYGLNYFIIRKHKSVQEAALLGFFTYAVYELTNLSLFKNWSITTVIIDTTWGTVLFGLTTAIVYKISQLF
jgi:uncharacterized membrane protein